MRRDEIDGVHIAPLKLVCNARGRLMEVQRRDDPHFLGFGQAYITSTLPGVVKAWYRHARQIDQIALVKGTLKLVLFDSRENSPTHDVLHELTINESAPALVQIPSGIWHGFQAINEETFSLHLNSEPFQFDAPDEERIAPDDPRIPYRWGSALR
jgi:dTDP-4-dehydrorhamnose 3,5-epimerase